MSESRSFENIFLSLQNLVHNKEQAKKNSNTTLPKCLCGRNEYDSSSTAEEDTENEDINRLDKNEPVYLEKTTGGQRFAVCPSCNPRVHCELCEGTGHRTLTRYVVFESEEGEEHERSVNDINPNSCACTHTEKIVTLLNESGLPARYMAANTDSLRMNHLSEAMKKKLTGNLEKMLRFCSQEQFAQSPESDPALKHFMILYGPVGSGKTLLACLALKIFIMNYKVTGKFVDFQFLLNRIKLEYEQKKSGENLMQELRNVDVLVIDEFGKGRSENEWQLEKLDDLVNSRYNSQKVTIITTNYLLEKQKYDEKEIPRSNVKEMKNFWDPVGKSDLSQGQIPVNESFWNQSLLERVGARIYERIIEVSDFIEFTGIPSYRKLTARPFLERYSAQKQKLP